MLLVLKPPVCILSDRKNTGSLIELTVVETSFASLCEVKTRLKITSKKGDFRPITYFSGP